MLQLTLASRYLLGRKLRTTLTTLAVVFGVFILFGLNTIVPAVLGAFQSSILDDLGQVDVTVTHATGEAFSPSLLQTVQGVPGVRVASASLNRTLNLPTDFFDHDPIQSDLVSALTLVGLDPTQAQPVRSYPLQSGRFLQPGDTDVAVVTASLANALNLKLGDSFTLPTTKGQVTLTIVGLRPARTVAGNEEVLVSLPEAQQLLDRPGLINTIEVGFNTPDAPARAEIAQRLQTALGPDYVLGGLSSGTQLFAALRLAQVILVAFGTLAVAMGGFIIFNSFRTLVIERRRDLAMLRAVGANRRTILGLVLAESLLQGSVGTLLGILLGYFFSFAVLSLVSGLVERYVHLRLGGPVVAPYLIPLTLLIGIGLTVLAGLLPALSASRASPLEALRPTQAETESFRAGPGNVLGVILIVAALLGLLSGNLALAGLGSLCFMVGLVLIAPLLVQPIARVFTAIVARLFAGQAPGLLAQANLSRQPTRAAITASTIMLSLAIIVTVGGMVSSVSLGFLSLVRDTLSSDYLFVPPAVGVWASDVGADHSLVDRLRAIDGVDPDRLTTLRFATSAAASTNLAPGSLSTDTSLSLIGIDSVTFPRVSGFKFESGQPATAFAQLASGRTVILNGPASSSLGLKVGDSVRLATVHGVQTYQVIAIANDYLNAKVITGYISQAQLAMDFDKTEDVFVQVNLKPGVAASAVEPQLRALAARYPQFRLTTGAAYVAENEDIFSRSFVSLYFMFTLLTVPSLIALLNTLAIGVLARTREIGMLRAVGATQTQMSRMVIAEALLLTALGIALGLFAGLYLGYVLVGAISLQGYSIPYVFPLTWLFVGIAFGLIFGVLAALFPARQAARLEIVQALRYE